MKIFVSYSALDKKIASQIKKLLKKYGLNVFLAHDDIEPSEEWIERILIELKSCDVFIPLLTEHFDESNWTDQETGFVLARDIPIIPLKLSVDPHGFISKFQALKIDLRNLEVAIEKLTKTIASKPKLKKVFRDALIKKFGNSDTFQEAKENTQLLLSFNGYSTSQIEKIIKYAIENYQIHGSFAAKRELKYFVNRQKNSIDQRLLDDFHFAVK